LYSVQDRAWKIADFGLTSEGTSKHAQTTRHSRGTSGYRAPELVNGEKYLYTNKVDVWAIGCILYELVLHEKAFTDDLHVVHYSLPGGPTLKLPLTSQVVQDKNRRLFLSNRMLAMLELDESKRPRAEELYNEFLKWESDNKVDSSPLLLSSAQTYGLLSIEELTTKRRVAEGAP
jgi:serine/threonine protein kinase